MQHLNQQQQQQRANTKQATPASPSSSLRSRRHQQQQQQNNNNNREQTRTNVDEEDDETEQQNNKEETKRARALEDLKEVFPKEEPRKIFSALQKADWDNEKAARILLGDTTIDTKKSTTTLPSSNNDNNDNVRRATYSYDALRRQPPQQRRTTTIHHSSWSTPQVYNKNSQHRTLRRPKSSPLIPLGQKTTRRRYDNAHQYNHNKTHTTAITQKGDVFANVSFYVSGEYLSYSLQKGLQDKLRAYGGRLISTQDASKHHPDYILVDAVRDHNGGLQFCKCDNTSAMTSIKQQKRSWNALVLATTWVHESINLGKKHPLRPFCVEPVCHRS
eukprot:TRINITY_DN66428_c7_g1_i3.p1 TRINITY_DN66428_c7_g1~~TRINITY_DN66428_c7_g1_i3.p1  ORF type:complete len:331 (-),score=60.62 TRINITY_DN66428_c7_g1_i3:493-1485(-)